jgi:hypothetical protein
VKARLDDYHVRSCPRGAAGGIAAAHNVPVGDVFAMEVLLAASRSRYRARDRRVVPGDDGVPRDFGGCRAQLRATSS